MESQHRRPLRMHHRMHGRKKNKKSPVFATTLGCFCTLYNLILDHTQLALLLFTQLFFATVGRDKANYGVVYAILTCFHTRPHYLEWYNRLVLVYPLQQCGIYRVAQNKVPQ